MATICSPWRMYGKFSDGYSACIGGDDEGECVWKLDRMQGKHGDLTYYTGLNDENYVDGELQLNR